MKEYFAIGSRLAIICAAAALLLAVVNAITEPVIASQKQKDREAAIAQLAGNGTVGEDHEVSDNPVVKSWLAVTSGGRVNSYVLSVVGRGYGGDMRLLAAYDPDGDLLAAKLMEHNETPGLGKKAESDEYMRKYIRRGRNRPVPFLKNQLAAADADTITSATITYTGIGKALNAGSQFVKTLGGAR